MAVAARRHPAGADGDWFIDDRCISCGACRAAAPDLFAPLPRVRQYVLTRQPADAEEVVLAQQAAEVCPTRSIGTESGLTWEHHHPVQVAPGVWRTGWNDTKAIGGNAFLVERPDGNVLVDAPSFLPRVTDAIEERGGLRRILLTHRDDVGDAQRFAEAFGAEVHIHHADRSAAPFATHVLHGTDPVDLGDGVTVIPTPGHTAGHVMYLVDEQVLFTGDSLVWEPDRDDLWARRDVCWHSWPQQLDSLERLAEHDFTKVVPTHGVMSPTLPAHELRVRLLALVAELR